MKALVRLNRAAAVARTFRHASEAMGQVARLQRALGPGSFLHDLVVLANPKATEARRMAAERRLACHHLKPSDVFYIDRWLLVEDPFRAWRGDRTFFGAWEELVVPFVLTNYDSIPRDILLVDVKPYLRRLLRSTIERELMGHTLDQRARLSPLGDPDTYEAEDVIEAADQRVEVSVVLRGLEPHEQMLLREYYGARAGGAGRKALAKRLGISDARLRKRAERARGRARKFPA